MSHRPPGLERWSAWPAPLQAAVTAVAYLACALGTAAATTGAPDGVPDFWPPAGVAVVALLLAAPRRWPLLVAAIAAAAAAAVALGAGPDDAHWPAFAAAAVLGPAAGAAATLALLGGRRPDLSGLDDVGATVLGACATTAAVGGLAGAAALALAGEPGFWDMWLRWAMGAGTGVVLVAPVILGVPAEGRRAPVLDRPAEAFAAVAAAVGLGLLVVGSAPLSLGGLGLLPVVVAAVRLGVVGGALAALAVGVVLMAETTAGRGMYAEVASDRNAVVLAQMAVLVGAVFAITVAALTIERTRVGLRLRDREQELRRLQRMESLGVVAGSVAHDFNNVLAAVRGQAERALQEAERGGDPTSRLRLIVQGADSGSALARQILTFGRQDPARTGAAELNAVAQEMHDLLDRVLGPQVELRLDLDPSAGAVVADRTEVEQVVLNLVANARDALTGAGTVTIATRAEGHEAVVAVSDTGVGMDRRTAERALERGFTTKAAGSGLGLATVQAIAERHGGRLAIDSAPGLGTTVRVSLPRLAGTVPAAAPPAARASVDGRPTILLAEDSPHVLALMRVALEESGYCLLEARDGLEAVEVARNHDGPIHLLVADLAMPGLGGPEVHRRLAAERPGLRALFVSGAGEDVAARDGIDPSALLGKPFGLVELAQRVRDALGGPLAA